MVLAGQVPTVSSSHVKVKGDRALAVGAPRPWRELPEEPWLVTSVSSLKSLLKTYFHRKAFL